MANISQIKSDFTYSTTFEFEKRFDYRDFTAWMVENWSQCFWYSAVYIVLVFGIKHYMQNRPKFDLRPALALWSLVLAIFSIFGAARTLPELTYVLHKYGFEFSICDGSFFKGPTAFWAFIFTASKAYELGDTLFIVLRKQQLIFLHWYHHIITLIYVWVSYTEYIGPGRWFMTMNFMVHSVMYSYYALRAMKFHIPRWISMIITLLQIIQMIIGTYVNISAYQIKQRGEYCSVSMNNLHFSTVMYISYFALFSHFFYKSYIASKPRSEVVIKDAQKKTM